MRKIRLKPVVDAVKRSVLRNLRRWIKKPGNRRTTSRKTRRAIRQPETFDVFISPNLHVVANLFDRSKPVIVMFASGGKPRRSEFETLSDRYEINFINVACKDLDWWQYPEMPDAMAAVAGLAQQFSKTITYGDSMGGYGALLWSTAVGADIVVAGSPQAAMGPNIPPEDDRWQNDRARINAELGWPHDDMTSGLSRTADIIVVYDPLDTDRHHVTRLQAIRPIQRIIFPLTGHATALHLVWLGLGSHLIRSLADGTFTVAGFQSLLNKRRRNPARAVDAAMALVSKNKAIPSGILRLMLDPESRATPDKVRRVALYLARAGRRDDVYVMADWLAGKPEYLARPAVADFTTFANLLANHPKVAKLTAKLCAIAAVARYGQTTRAVALLCAARLAHFDNPAQAVALTKTAGRWLSGWDEENGLVAQTFADFGKPDLAEPFRLRTSMLSATHFQTWEIMVREPTRNQDWEKVIEIWKEALAAGADYVRVGVGLSKAFMKMSKWQEALWSLSPAYELPSPAFAVEKARAQCLMQLQRFDEAEPFYRKVLSTAPNDLGAHGAMVRILTARGDLAGSLPHAEAVARLFPSPGKEQALKNLRKKLGISG